jgi:hypothetical protein
VSAHRERFRWATRSARRALHHRYAVADLAGAAVRFHFRGTGVDWVTTSGPDQGRAAIYVDGSLVETVNERSATRSFRVTRSIGGLSDTEHTLKIVAIGPGRTSTGAVVSVDAWDVV